MYNLLKILLSEVSVIWYINYKLGLYKNIYIYIYSISLYTSILIKFNIK